jgi:nicotinamidase-related amidase
MPLLRIQASTEAQLPDRYRLHGAQRCKCSTALLLIDVINDMEFPEGEKLLRQTLPAARKIAALKMRAVAAGIPAIYVNDNFGKWRSDFQRQVRHCLQDGVRGEPVARLLAPDEEDYFVLKPKSSAFFGTTLHSLLNHLQVRTLVLTGVAADICILFTAHDAHLLDYQIIVPSDCVASNFKRETTAALANMKKATHALVCESPMIHFSQGKVRTTRPRAAKSLPRAA